mgnify:CR=1 FL=1
MALTQISTNGIKDSTIATADIADDAVTTDKLANSINTEITANTAKTTNATHTGEVTGSGALTITDDVVDEANLKISNAGSNGQFLQKQSGNTGGLTWATVDTSIADDAVTQAKIADEAVDEARLQISNAGSNGNFLQKQSGNTGGLTWADPGGGAWEVISSTLLDSSSLPSTGGYKYVESKGWSNSYARYKVTFDGINRESPGGGQQTFKLWIQWYISSSTLLTGSAYKAKGANIGGSNFTNGDSTKWGPYNDANTYRLSGEITIPMFNSGSEDINKHMYATWVADDELYMERCYYDHNSNDSTDHIKGMQIRFVDGGSDLNGRITFLRQKYS